MPRALRTVVDSSGSAAGFGLSPLGEVLGLEWMVWSGVRPALFYAMKSEPPVSALAGQSDRDRVLAATDLLAVIGEHITLKPKGREHVGLCPFHDDSSPSMRVVTHKGNAFYKCFACGAAGNAIDFMMNFHRMEFPDALRHLASKAGILLTERPRDRRSDGVTKTDLQEIASFAAREFQRWLRHAELGAQARTVIASRGISDESVRQFQLGASPAGWDHLLTAARREQKSVPALAAAGLVKARREGEGWFDMFRNRVMFPIADELGNVIAFGARKIAEDDEPKYLNSPESAVFSKSRALYALHLAKKSIIDTRTVIVTEGYTDVIACHAAGFTNVVATLGTALTRDHARILKRLCETVVLLFDGDEAGQKAADRALEVFFAEPIDVKICTLPEAKDPDELLRMEGGRERFAAALEASADAMKFMMQRFGAGLGSTATLSGRQQRLEAMLAHLADLGFNDMSGIRRALVISSIAEFAGIGAEQVDAAARAVQRRPSAARAAMETGETTEAQGQPGGAAADEQTLCPRNRRLAERRVLSTLLAAPHVASARVSAGEGHTLPFTEAFGAGAFLEAQHREICAVMLPLLEEHQEFTIQRLMAELASDQSRDLVSTLYLEGLDRLGDDMNEAVNELHAACLELESLEHRERARTFCAEMKRGSDGAGLHDVSNALAAIEHIRRRGQDQAAIARRARG